MRTWSKALIPGMILMCGMSADAPGQAWPACRVVSGRAGGPAILINKQVFSPIMFMGNNQFDNDDVLIEQVRLAAEAGLDLISFGVTLNWDGPSEANDAVIARFCEANPKAYFYVRVWMGPPEAWREAHPDEMVQSPDGKPHWVVSQGSGLWREQAAERLQECVRRIIEGPHGHRFIGINPLYLQTGEWFYPDTNEFWDYSPANLAAFRGWLKSKYRGDKKLREAWGDPEATITTARFASPEEREAADWGPFRLSKAHARAADMHRFQQEQIAGNIKHFARAVKETTKGRSLVGVFYGYTMEMSGNGPRALAHGGHLALRTVLDSDAVDILHAPYSYYERRLGEPGHLMVATESLVLAGKLGLFEDDTFTHLSREPVGLIAPGYNERTKTLPETIDINRRNFANMLNHRAGMWIFDLLSDGRWNDRAFWQASVLSRRVAAELRQDPVLRPQVAFVVSERAADFMRSTTDPHLTQALYAWRAELDRLGTPVGYYLQDDLPRLPDSVRMVILANAYSLDPGERRTVEALLKRGGTVVWTYAAGIADGGPEAVSRTTGFALEVRDDDIPWDFESLKTDEKVGWGPMNWGPRFVVVDEDVDVLCRYQQTGEVYAAAKPAGNGVAVYTAGPRLPAELLRWMGTLSGVHFYTDKPQQIGILGDYVIVHAEADGPLAFRWTEPLAKIERIIPPMSFPLARDSAAWTDLLERGKSYVYLLHPENDE
jgi:beta-galactosidase